MGFFDSVASTVFNTATSAYNTVVRPVTTAASSVVRTVSQPIVQGSYSTGATEQVAVQPKPPIVTAVSNRPVTPSPGTTVTPQTTPSGQQVYVTSRASPVQPDPVTVTRPVQIQAPSAAQLIGSLAPGGALVGAAQLISGDQNVLRNVVMDLPGTGTFTGTPTLAGYRETAIKQQQIAAQTRIQQQEQAIAGFKQEVAQRKTLQEQAILGYNQREQALRREVSEFNALGPATSIEEYNSRLSTANLLNTKIQGLQAEGSQINADILAGNRNLYKKQIGLLNESDAINRDLVNLNVASANLGTTGIGGLTLGFEERVNKPISNIALTEIGKPFGMTKEDVALGLQLNRMASESMVTYGGPSTFNLGTAYGAGMLQDTLMKPGEAIVWTGVGIATGGVTRALAPGMEAAVAASRVPGASLGARALGTGIRAAPYVMGAAFAGQVGFETGFESTPTGLKIRSPGGMVSRLGGLTATEIVPMVGGGIIGYNAPEIGQAAYRGIRAGELRFRQFGEGLGEEGILGPSRGRGSGKIKEIEIKTQRETLLDKEAMAKIRALTGENEEILFLGPEGKPAEVIVKESGPNFISYKLELPPEAKPSDYFDIHTHPGSGRTFSPRDIKDMIGSNPRTAVVKTGTGEIHVLERPAHVDYTEKMFEIFESRTAPNFVEGIEDKIFGTSFTRERALAKTAKETGISFRKFSPETETIESAFGVDIPVGKSTTGPTTIDISPGFDYLNEPRGRLTAKPGARSASIIDDVINVDIYAKAPEPEEIFQNVARATQIPERGNVIWDVEPAVNLKPEQLLPIPVERTISFPTGRGGTPTVRIGDIRLPPTPAYEVVGGRGIFRGLVAPEGETIELVKVFERTPKGIGKTIVQTQMRYPKTIETIDLGMEGGMITRGPKGQPIIDIRSDPFMNPRTGEIWLRGFGTEKSIKLIDANAKSPFIEKTPTLEGRINKAVKDISLGISRPTEQLKTHQTYKDWKHGMQAALGIEGEEPIIPSFGKEPGFVKAPKTTAGQARVGIGISGTASDRASAINLGATGLGMYGIPIKEMGALVGETGPEAYQRFLRQIDYEKFYGIGTYPTTNLNFGGTDDMQRPINPTILRNRAQPKAVYDFTRVEINPSQRNIEPINIGTRGLLPIDLIGESNLPDTTFRVTPIQRVGPIELLIPESRITPIPDITTKLITDQILITTPEIPPYTPPPEYTFEIPPIPPIIIPGFPMGLGGGGGGGGSGGDRGGYLFEETLKGGGESDPFGIGGMNFDALGMMGIPKGTGSGKRRRRRK